MKKDVTYRCIKSLGQSGVMVAKCSGKFIKGKHVVTSKKLPAFYEKGKTYKIETIYNPPSEDEFASVYGVGRIIDGTEYKYFKQTSK